MKMLLHSCCGPCSTAVIEKLKDDYELTVFYFNPNIHPREEYELRKENQKKVCEIMGVPFIEGDYDPQLYYAVCKGLEAAPEGGERCKACFRLRMEETARLAKDSAFDCFDTTLSVSPHKNYDAISEAGHRAEEKYGVEYVSGNYKKKDGYKRSTELSEEYGLYRQNYCGCEFSKR